MIYSISTCHIRSEVGQLVVEECKVGAGSDDTILRFIWPQRAYPNQFGGKIEHYSPKSKLWGSDHALNLPKSKLFPSWYMVSIIVALLRLLRVGEAQTLPFSGLH
jgi:hypothetical protein